MARVKRGVTAHARHKKVLKLAKGYVGRSHSTFRPALERVEKGLQYAYRDRRNKKRDFRGLWIQRINAGARELGLTYSKLMSGIKKAGIAIERKVRGAALNTLKDELTAALDARAQALSGAALDQRLTAERIDVTLPPRPLPDGRIHPISQTIDEMVAIFGEMGFVVAEGPDVE